jgi:hypothetical protein
MSLLAQVMSTMEGFGVPGAIPTVRNNPLNLRHGPNATHPQDDPDGIGYYATVELGWADGERQLGLYAERNLTLQAAIYEFAPPNENDSANYLNFVCQGVGCSPDTLVSAALTIPGTDPTE